MTPSEIRYWCLENAKRAPDWGAQRTGFNALQFAHELEVLFLKEPDPVRAKAILDRGFGATAQEIWVKGSQIVAYLSDGTVPTDPQPQPAS